MEARALPAVGFNGVSLPASGFIPPDTMGAVGPNHFVENINGAFAIYTKAGALVSNPDPDVFFDPDGAGPRPYGGTFDPRILFDQPSGRWFATTMEFGQAARQNNDIILAVSRTGDPTGVWDKYVIPLGVPTSGTGETFFTDYSTLGVDSNGVYFAARIFGSVSSNFAKIAATPKAPLIAAVPSLGTVTQFSNITDMYSVPQPAVNYDPVAANARAFFVSSSPSVFQNIHYRSLTWAAGVPSLSATSILTTAAYGNPINAPASGSTTNINVGDDRLQMAVIQDGRLWTARNVGLNSTGGASTPTRTGIEWFELNASTPTLSIAQTARIFDTATTDPRYYYYPSIAVSGQGHMRIGFSGSKGSEFVGAYSSSRLATDPLNTTSAPVLIKAGEGSYTRTDGIGRNRWGDYSYTSIDPNDNMTLWTIQEFAGLSNNWGTWIQSFDAPAPTLNNPNGSAGQGQNNVILNLTGTRFYDPGAGFSNRLSVQLTGGAINGISNLVTTFLSPTSAQVSFDIAGNASPGARNIVLTNPDGQSATVIGGFNVVQGATRVVYRILNANDVDVITTIDGMTTTQQFRGVASVDNGATAPEVIVEYPASGALTILQDSGGADGKLQVFEVFFPDLFIPVAGVSSLVFQGSTGNDFFIANAMDAAFAGVLKFFCDGGGDIALGLLQTAAQVMEGNEGNDILFGGYGNDTITGGAGSDFVHGGFGGIDAVIDAITGSVALRGARPSELQSLLTKSLRGVATSPLVLAQLPVLPNSGSAAILTGNGTDVYQSIENFVFLGSSGPDSINASRYNASVTLLGAGGNDTLWGSTADDLLDGGDGDDQVNLVASANLTLTNSNLSGAHGNDSLNSIERAVLTVTGTSGRLVDAAGFSGAVSITGGSGNDTILGSGGGGNLIGNSGNDMITGGRLGDIMNGGNGDDVLLGGGGSDTLSGGIGNDILEGGDEADVLNGNRGRDVLIGGLGMDQLNGNEGDNLVIAGIFNGPLSWLLDVRTEWTGPGTTEQRRARLLNGTGPTGVRLTEDVIPNSESDLHPGNGGTNWLWETERDNAVRPFTRRG